MKARLRITPAYAGKTGIAGFNVEVNQDHPRVCGKDYLAITPFVAEKGSPPRMRERREKMNEMGLLIRITPAYAGKTLPCLSVEPFRKDHPRVCGKDEMACKTVIRHMGSPPRMRERRHSWPRIVR